MTKYVFPTETLIRDYGKDETFTKNVDKAFTAYHTAKTALNELNGLKNLEAFFLSAMNEVGERFITIDGKEYEKMRYYKGFYLKKEGE